MFFKMPIASRRPTRCRWGMLALVLFILIDVTHLRLASAADFFYQPGSKDYGPESVSIRGEIRRGDFDRFKEFLLVKNNLKAYTNFVWLNSPGGDVAEAMKFAALFDRSSASVIVGPYSKCYSACFAMYAGGVNRILFPLGELGVHRVALSALEVDLNKGKALVLPVALDIYSYLIQQGIPRPIVDKMMETPATDMFKIDMELLERHGWYGAMSNQPTFFDTTEKACGRNPDPSPSKSQIGETRDDRTKKKVIAWVDCKAVLQNKNTISFIESEFELAKQGKNSVIFPVGKLNQIRQAVSLVLK